MVSREWVRLPTDWINKGGLRALRWGKSGKGADNTAALMGLMAIAHAAEDSSGVTRLTYDQLCTATGLSRSKLSNGLCILEELGVIERRCVGESTYRLAGYDVGSGWGKLPAKGLYTGHSIHALKDFSLRREGELEGLKLYFLFVARRDRETNQANISYDKIEEYTGIRRERITTAISVIAALPLVYVEHVPSKVREGGVANAYRIVGIESYRHMGTKGRMTATL